MLQEAGGGVVVEWGGINDVLCGCYSNGTAAGKFAYFLVDVPYMDYRGLI